ncbi:MAG: hypothetical protein KAU90_11485 [Sulfurovaceae bacterium]|nr:hypothetical protein [Sulfurovaceae bacterium]
MKITDEIKEEVQSIVDTFNKKHKSQFLVKYRGKFLYLGKVDGFNITNVGRLEFRGDMKNWSFAVFKYSSERYNPNEFFFPGQSELDGTIEGALRAGLEIY